MKKIVLFLALFCLFAIPVSAAGEAALTAPDGFYVYAQNPEKVADILKTDSTALQKSADSSKLLYLAVNANNTKQIQITCEETDFSHSVINMTNLSNDSILAILPDLTGLATQSGEIVYSGGQKCVKTNVLSQSETDSYILTQYFTVAEKKLYTLSFYTSADENTDYIEKSFSSCSSPDFIKSSATRTDNNKFLRAAVLAAAIVLFLICLWFIFSLTGEFVSFRKSKATQDVETDPDETEDPNQTESIKKGE